MIYDADKPHHPAVNTIIYKKAWSKSTAYLNLGSGKTLWEQTNNNNPMSCMMIGICQWLYRNQSDTQDGR